MHCVICDGLEDSGKRYMANALNKRTSSDRISESLVWALGFCGRHTAELHPELGGASKFQECAVQAARWLKEITEKRQSYSERLNEIIFRSRWTCPACLYQRRLEGLLVSRFCRTAPTAKRQLARYLEGNICLSHLYAAMPGFYEIGLGRVAVQTYNAIVRRLRECFGVWSMENYLSESKIPQEFTDSRRELAKVVGLSRRVGELRDEQAAGVHIDAMPACQCSICAAVRDARQQWRLRLIRAVDFGYPLRLVAPVCPEHIVQCLLDDSLPAAHAAWSRFLQSGNQLRKIKAPDSTTTHQRKGASWHLPRPEQPEEVEIAHVPAHFEHFCPACSAAEIARTRGALCFSAQHRLVPERDIKLCLKHFAEVYILEPRAAFRENLAANRMADLEAHASKWPMWAFGTFS